MGNEKEQREGFDATGHRTRETIPIPCKTRRYRHTVKERMRPSYRKTPRRNASIKTTKPRAPFHTHLAKKKTQQPSTPTNPITQHPNSCIHLRFCQGCSYLSGCASLRPQRRQHSIRVGGADTPKRLVQHQKLRHVCTHEKPRQLQPLPLSFRQSRSSPKMGVALEKKIKQAGARTDKKTGLKRKKKKNKRKQTKTKMQKSGQKQRTKRRKNGTHGQETDIY